MVDVPRRGQRVKYQPGYRFEGTRLTVVKHAGTDSSGNTTYLFRCDCGAEKIIRASRVKSRVTVSCGCYQAENNIAKSIVHGHAANGKMTREYRTWNSMNERCYNENCPAYVDYGARGITVCDRWRHDFPAFLADMGPKPKGMTLDRRDNDLGYSPDNCRWVTRKDQQNNRRVNRLMTLNGETMTMMQWSERTGFTHSCLMHRVVDLGWTDEQALTTPLGVDNGNGSRKSAARNRKSTVYLELNGESKCLAEWEEQYGLPHGVVSGRLRLGWSPAEAVTTPVGAKRRPRAA